MTVRVFIRRDTSDIHARFTVYDEYENLMYHVTGKSTTSGNLMKVVAEGFTAAKIRDLELPVVSAYSIAAQGESVKLFFSVRAGVIKARYAGISWRIRGDVLSGSYDILDADGTIICAVCEHFSRNYTELCIFDQSRELFCISSVLCVNSLSIEREAQLQLT